MSRHIRDNDYAITLNGVSIKDSNYTTLMQKAKEEYNKGYSIVGVEALGKEIDKSIKNKEITSSEAQKLKTYIQNFIKRGYSR